MSRIIFVLIALALAGCGRLQLHKPKDPKPGIDRSAVQAAYDRELALYVAATGAAAGWPSETDCDGALWAGVACMGGAPVAIERAELAQGGIGRRPADRPACWSKELGDQGSQSSTSRDMVTGYLGCLWTKGDLPALRRFADFAQERSFVVGEPLSSGSVDLRPNLTGLLGRMIHALSGGTDDRFYRFVSYNYDAVAEDYEEHLQAEGITLQGAVDGGITDDAKGRLETLAALRPEDYLIQAVAAVYSGDFGTTVTLLLDPETPAPSYVRGDQAENYRRALWLRAARLVLDRMGDG
jgi:hypothetical protein